MRTRNFRPQLERLLKLMRDATAMAFRLPMIDVGREDEGVSHVPRLFRNAPGLFYVGRVHEQVFSSLEVRRAEWGLENKLGDATLLHHGYTKELVQSRDKVARNLRLLEMAIIEMPGEPNADEPWASNWFGLAIARRPGATRKPSRRCRRCRGARRCRNCGRVC
jgi:hypothetical protein